MWLLAAFSSVTDLPCDSEGLHGSHKAGLRPAMQQNRQASPGHVPGSYLSHWQRHQILVMPHMVSPHEKEAGTEGSWLA